MLLTNKLIQLYVLLTNKLIQLYVLLTNKLIQLYVLLTKVHYNYRCIDDIDDIEIHLNHVYLFNIQLLH